MAKYAEYAKRNDALSEEIEEAKEATEVRRDVPDSVRRRFDGKTPEEIMESFASLERKLSEQGQEMGRLRQTADQLIELQLQRQAEPQRQDTTESVEPLTVDELYDNPDEAISRKVEATTKKQLEKIERQLAAAELERARAQLENRYKGWEDEVRSPEFMDWVRASSYRQRTIAAADSGDLDAANDLLGDWYERKQSTQEFERKQKRNRQLDDAALETSGPAGLESEVTFSRHELMQKRIQAHRGNLEAQDWLRANANAINLAYEEERITD
jgi:hypothetical protein